MSADLATEDKFIAAFPAGWPASDTIIAKRKKVIAKPIKAKKPIVRTKIAAGMALAKKIKKTWMIHLPQ